MQSHGDELVTRDGRQRYPVREGVPGFLALPVAEDDEGRTKLERLLQEARRSGWRQAFEEVYADDPAMRHYVLDPTRARFLDLLPLTAETRVLEIGPGFGQFTRRMARRVGHLSALEVVPGQARFVAESCRQEGLDNVRVACGGDDCRLPYAEGSFDLVVLNLVFEWCGAREEASHEDAQRRLLSEMQRVLAPGGMLYLATKNRFALRYLLGKGDEHAHHLPFGHALPRPLLQRMLRRAGHERSSGRLYSLRELRSLLEQAGFTQIENFWAAPEVRTPDRLIPARGEAIRAARAEGGFREGDSRSTRALMPLVPSRWVAQVAHGLVLTARKQPHG